MSCRGRMPLRSVDPRTGELRLRKVMGDSCSQARGFGVGGHSWQGRAAVVLALALSSTRGLEGKDGIMTGAWVSIEALSRLPGACM